jgi:AraC-like DNA-binding protein
MAYKNEIRLQRAKTMLKFNTVSFVSEKLGFSSIYVFSRAFKNRFGIAPSNIAKAE